MDGPATTADPAAAVGPATREPAEPGLVRALGPGMATALVVGNVIGAGIFLKPGEAAAHAGTVPIVFAAWAAGGVLSLLGALTLAEIAVRLPRAGGLYVYLREAFGRPVAFLYGWSEFVFGMPASIGALAAGTVGVLAAAAGWRPDVWEGAAAAVLLIAALAAVNVAGVLWSGRTQVATTAVKCGFLVLLAALPFALSAAGHPGGDAANLWSVVTPSAGTDAGLAARFAGALLAVLWAYNGWHAVAPVAEEVREPRRNLPLALLGGTALLTAIYLATVAAYHVSLPMDAVREAGIGLPQVMVRTLLGPLGGGIGPAAAAVISAAAACSMAGSLNACLINGPRVGFAMARDGCFFRPLAAVHPRFHTPAAAIVTQATLAAVLVGVSAALVASVESFRKRDVFDLLSNYVTFAASVFLTLAVAAIFPLRRRGRADGYSTPLYPFVPLLFIAGSAAFVAAVLSSRPEEAATGVLLTLAGLPVYFWLTRRTTAPSA